MLELFGRRFVGYLVTLACGLGAARFVTDGVQLEHFYSFSTTLFAAYVAGQSVTDSVKYLKAIKEIVRG